MYHYTDDQNSCMKPRAQTPMKATIICLPPILHTCQNVPAAIIKPSVTDSTDYNNYFNNKNYNNDNINNNSKKKRKKLNQNPKEKKKEKEKKKNNKTNNERGYSDSVTGTGAGTTTDTGTGTGRDTVIGSGTITTSRGGSCCHHWEHKNYDYEKHNTTTTREMVATTTPKGQHNHTEDQEEQRQNTHQQRTLRTRNSNSNSTTTNRTVRERRRNFYNLKENIASLMLSKTTASTMLSMPSSSSSSALLSSSVPQSWLCRTMAMKSVAKNAESTTSTPSNIVANVGSSSPTLKATSTATSTSTSTLNFWSSMECDLHIKSIENSSNDLNEKNLTKNNIKNNNNNQEKCTPKQKTNENGNENHNRNVCIDDRFILRTKQLVMPIVNVNDSSSEYTSTSRRQNVIYDGFVVEKKEVELEKEMEEQKKDMDCKLAETQSHSIAEALLKRPLAKKEMKTTITTTTPVKVGSEKHAIEAAIETNVRTTTGIYKELEKEKNIEIDLDLKTPNTTATATGFANTSANTTMMSKSTTAAAYAKISQTTKKQFTFDELLCPRATNAGDIITHEVENFKWSDDDDDDDDDRGDGYDDGDRTRNSSSCAAMATTSALNRLTETRMERQQHHQQQQQQQQEKLYPVYSIPIQSQLHTESSNSLRRPVQRQQLWQQMSLTLAVLVMVGTGWLQRQRHQVVKMFTTSPGTKLLLSTLMLLMLITTANCWAGRQDVPSNCTFPLRWEGSWFLSGYQQSIHIKGSQISYRGKCAASDGNKYLIVDEKGCHRCLVIYEKHENVLQYKESECEGDSMYMHQSNPSAMAMRSVLNKSGGDHRGGAHPNTNGHSRLSSSDQYIMRSNDDMNDYFCKGRETLQNLCDQIPGDALLYSLFRENAEPVKCPLKGPFIFTYNRGHGECKSPVSNIESCTEDSRLLLSFQACPDVQGTESTVEELTCLAAWKDGNSRYLVGLVSHHHAISNEERYRCFVYEKISTLIGGPSMLTSKDAEYKLAQSGDATCNGLDSAEVGSRIMTLRKPPVAERCDFPVWFKGPRHWHALMGNAVYNYHTNDGSVHIIKSNGYMETRALCEQINKQTSTEMMAVVHYTTGCQSGFMCMMFYRRDTHVIEIQTGKQASRLEDACAPDHFDIHKMPYITLLASNPDPQICPMEGLYNLRGAIGPPYLATRHKRNHNNKAHSLHGHHHFSDGLGSSTTGTGISSSSGGSGNSDGSASGDAYEHKRRGTLSFRNFERVEKGSWHANTRGLPIRSRRDAAIKSKSVNLTAAGTMTRTNDSTSNVNEKELLLHQTQEQNPTTMTTITTTTSMTMMMTGVSTDLAIVRQRNRRDVPGCITNFKAQRQLWVGCTEPNVIDVRPLCNDEGDEEYYCHGSWTENTTVYIIARHKRTKHGVCISYRPTEGTSAKLVIGDACYRGTEKPPEHHLVANLSVFGKCGETGAASSTKIHTLNCWLTLAVAILAPLLSSKWNRLDATTSILITNHR